MKFWIPNIVTSLNLVFGMLSIFAAFHGNLWAAAIFIVLAMVADGMDGRVARYFNASSELGKELDSLCDLVSFGVAPAVLAFIFMLKDFSYWGYGAAVIFAACGAFRLARFNVNTGVVKGFFMGLPIPAGGCVVATFVMLDIHLPGFWFPVLITGVGYLMVSSVHYPDFKGAGERMRLFPAVISLVLAGWILWNRLDAVLFVPFIGYTVFGILNTLTARLAKN